MTGEDSTSSIESIKGVKVAAALFLRLEGQVIPTGDDDVDERESSAEYFEGFDAEMYPDDSRSEEIGEMEYLPPIPEYPMDFNETLNPATKDLNNGGDGDQFPKMGPVNAERSIQHLPHGERGCGDR